MHQEKGKAYIIVRNNPGNGKGTVTARMRVNNTVAVLTGPGEQRFVMDPGLVRISVNSGKELKFVLSENEVRTFHIIDAAGTTRFALKYGMLVALKLLFIFLIIDLAMKGKNFLFHLVVFLLFICGTVWDLSTERLLLKEI